LLRLCERREAIPYQGWIFTKGIASLRSQRLYPKVSLVGISVSDIFSQQTKITSHLPSAPSFLFLIV